MTTPPTAARVSGTIKALYERACDLVHHDTECPARGRGDEHCKCDAVPFLNDFEALAAIQPAPEPSARDALQVIADIPSTMNGSFDHGLEVAYRAVEALFDSPPMIDCTPSSAGTVSVEAAARVLLDVRNRDGMTVLPEYVREMLRALAGEGGR